MSYGNIPNEDALEEQINEVKFWLPCPGCGKANGCVVVIPVGRRYRAACDCGWRGPSVSSEIEAIAAWNIRARTPLETELIEALERINRETNLIDMTKAECNIQRMARAALRHADGQ